MAAKQQRTNQLTGIERYLNIWILRIKFIIQVREWNYELGMANIFLMMDFMTLVLVSILDELSNNVALRNVNVVNVDFLKRSSVSVLYQFAKSGLGVQLSPLP